VNLSDLAAMGAVPRWATLAISLPVADDVWLAQFSAGFFALANAHKVDLVGGDTTRGPLNLCVTIFGEVDAQQALRRSGAQAGDEIWVSGNLGDAALALGHMQGQVTLDDDEFASCAAALHQPQPRIALGLALRGLARSAIDISDGLIADLGHILDASGVGAEIDFSSLPVSEIFRRRFAANYLLSGGDDYELCFTAPLARHAEVLALSREIDLRLTRIGRIVAGRGCLVHDADGKLIDTEGAGYDHFR
jgi:thiamine-monophosphate kinase